VIPIIYNLLIAMAILSAFFIIYLKRQDPSIVDVAFTTSLIVMSISTYYLIDHKTAATHLFLLMSLLWGARLVILLIKRYQLGQKDRRYDELKSAFEDQQIKKFFFFFLFQGLAAFFLSFNFVVAYSYVSEVGFIQILAFVLFVLFLGLEILADYQMFQYRKVHHAKPGVLREGLWKYSRHPNYFFEVLVWCSFALFSTTGYHAIMGWLAVGLLTYFIFRVTGIPATEELMLKTKGEAYKQYQRTTSSFFPWFPKS